MEDPDFSAKKNPKRALEISNAAWELFRAVVGFKTQHAWEQADVSREDYALMHVIAAAVEAIISRA